MSFLVLLYLCFYPPPTAKVVFYLVALIARPSSLSLLLLHREPFICLVEGRFLVVFVDFILEMSFEERKIKQIIVTV